MREFLLVLSTVCFLGAEISAQKKVKELFLKDDISILLAYFFIDTYCIKSYKLDFEYLPKLVFEGFRKYISMRKNQLG